MRTFLTIMLVFSCQWALASDCSNLKPFKRIGSQKVLVTVARFFWTGATQKDEDVCSVEVEVNAFDVRGREEEAFNCLKPRASEIVSCKSKLGNEDSEITVLPASWIRSWKPRDRREYRFHSYVAKSANPKFYLDIFSRNLTEELKSQDTILEGAIKTGPDNHSDGFFIRAQFKK